jgi:hypothetical protein
MAKASNSQYSSHAWEAAAPAARRLTERLGCPVEPVGGPLLARDVSCIFVDLHIEVIVDSDPA